MMKKFIAILLVLVTCISFGLTACKSSSTEQPEQTDRIRYQGTHIFNVSESETEYLVKNGATQYKILVPSSMSKYEGIGATELQTLFREATGIQLVVEKESGAGYTHDANQKFISIGKTELFKSTGLVADVAVLEAEGYRIVTKDNNIYLFTSADVGNVYAVYGLLQVLFNFECYYYDCYELDTGITNLKLPILDVTDVPDFAVRGNATQSIRKNNVEPNTVHRMRISDEGYMINVGDKENGYTPIAFHNTPEILPIVDTNGNPVETDEANWHATGNNQLCYTAHGDPASYERMYKRVAYVIERCMMDYPTAEYPHKKMVSVSCEDEFTYCDCATCTRYELDYGAKSAAVILFLNDVMAEIREWMETDEGLPYARDEFYLIFFAYFAYLQAPTTYNEELGKYEFNNGLQIRDDVGVMLAINDVTSTVSMYDDANEDTRNNVLAWADVANIPYFWSYSGNTEWHASMWPSYEHLDEDTYNFYACTSDFYYHNYIDYSTENNTGFSALKLYIDAEMMWDCSQSIAELKDKWFNAMFGEAKDIMRELFEQELLYMTNLYDEHNARQAHGWGILFSNVDWSLSEVESWISLIKQAQEKNAKIYKNSNPEKYEMITHHINLEFYFPAIVLVMKETKETAGQLYIDVVKYLQENEEIFQKFRVGDSYSDSVWKNLEV